MIEPFAGLRLNSHVIKREQTLCLPYDCLSPAIERRLRRVPHNAIHLEEPRPNPRSARLTWQIWKEQGVVSRDPVSYYVLVERFRLNNGHNRGRPGTGLAMRAGILGLADLSPSSLRRIWPHEKRLRKFVTERKRHFETVKLHCSPIFLIAPDQDERLRRLMTAWLQMLPSGTDFGRAAFDGVQRWFVRVSDPDRRREISEVVRAQAGFLIADGHHRFTAAAELARQGKLKNTLCCVVSASMIGNQLKKHPKVPGRKALKAEPPSLPEIIELARRGGLLPRKSTYFWPKIPCGLVYAEI